MLVSTFRHSAALSMRYSVRDAELPYEWRATASFRRKLRLRRGFPPARFPDNRLTATHILVLAMC